MFDTVKKWNYGNYSSNNYGYHSMAFRDNFGNSYFFSYDTLVAFTDEDGLCIRENVWGSTTGKHLNWIDRDKSIRVDSKTFEDRLQRLRDKYGKKI